jgi:hypothetical protein
VRRKMSTSARCAALSRKRLYFGSTDRSEFIVPAGSGAQGVGNVYAPAIKAVFTEFPHIRNTIVELLLQSVYPIFKKQDCGGSDC